MTNSLKKMFILLSLPLLTPQFAHSAEQQESNMPFQFTSKQSGVPAYNIAYEAMKNDVYEGTMYEEGSPLGHPIISIAQHDLNGDNTKEIIAAPVEEADYGAPAMFCEDYALCPHYILQTDGKTILYLGIINAARLDFTDEKINGYQQLKAYLSAFDLSYFEVYSYNSELKAFTLAKTVGTPPPKTFSTFETRTLEKTNGSVETIQSQPVVKKD